MAGFFWDLKTSRYMLYFTKISNLKSFLPLPLVEGGSKLLSSLGSGDPPLTGALTTCSFPSNSGAKSDTMWCVHIASSTMCGDHLFPQPFCS